jgi:hypothetical protein
MLVGDGRAVLAASHKALCIGTKQLGRCGSSYILGVMMVSHPHYPSGEAGFIALIETRLVSSAKKAVRFSAPSRTARWDVADHELVYLRLQRGRRSRSWR